MSKPKAYIYQNYEGYAEVLFAENASKAKLYFMSSSVYDEEPYIDIRVRRVPKLDYLELPAGTSLEWNNPEHRIAMVQHLGLYCIDVDIEDCEACCANNFCDTYKDNKEESYGLR